MGQIKTGKFISTGEIVNLNLGFIPAYAEIRNANAAAGEVATLVYFNQNGDAQEIWEYCINDQGTAVAANILKKASAGYVSEYDTVTIGNRKSCTFDDTSGAAEDLISCTLAADVPANNDIVKFVAGGGLPTTAPTALVNYHVIDSEVYGAGTFRISLTKGGAAVNFGSDGTPANYFFNVSNPDGPVVQGGKGLAISASFSDDSDVIFYVAIEADRDENLGDSANW
jgi:hypothetical protein